MSNANSLWCWLLRVNEVSETHCPDNADVLLVKALTEGAGRLGLPLPQEPDTSGCMFSCGGLKIYSSNGGENNTISDAGEGGGEVPWSLGHRPFLLMHFASNRLNAQFIINERGEPKLMMSDEAVRPVPEFKFWADYEAFFDPLVEQGINLSEVKKDLISLGLIQGPLSFGLDDDDDNDFIL